MERFTESRLPQHFFMVLHLHILTKVIQMKLHKKAPLKRRKPITDSMETSSSSTRFEKAEYAKFNDKINLHEGLSNSTEPTPSLIKVVLVTGNSYSLHTITKVETPWGPYNLTRSTRGIVP